MKYYRIECEDAVYHVTCRCNNQERLFHEEYALVQYLKILKNCKEKYGFAVYDYTIMSNHVHIIVKPGPTVNISKIMHSINRWYARWYNEHYMRKGHFWEARFDSVIIKDDFQLLATMRYIDNNPVRAGLCVDPADWKYSGANHYLKGAPNSLLDMPKTYISLGSNDELRRCAYKSIVSISI